MDGVDDARLIGRTHELADAVDRLRAGPTVNLVVAGGVASGLTSFLDLVAREVREPGQPLLRIGADRSSSRFALAAVAPFSAGVAPTASQATVIATAVGRLSEPGAIVLIDDAHHLDEASAVVVAQAARAGARLLVGVAEGRHLPAPLIALERDSMMGRAVLAPLGDSSISRLVADVLGGPVEPGVVRAVTSLVGWAPAAVCEVLRAAADSGAVARSGRVWRLRKPLAITRGLTARVDDLVGDFSSDTLEALDMLAIAGAAPWDMAVSAIGSARVELLDEHGVVRVSAEADRRVEIAERVVRAVRLAAISTSRARRLGTQLEVAWLRQSGDRTAPTEVDRALTARLAIAAGHPVEASVALEAAHAARNGGDLALAEQICRGELARVGPAELSIAITLAELLTAMGRNAEADALLVELRPDGPAEDALVTMARAVNLGMHLDRTAEAIDLLDAARARVMDEHWSAELVGLRAVLDLLLGRTDAALATASPHLAAARGRHFVEAATAAGPSLVMVGRHLDALALSERAYEERLALGEQPVLIGPGLHLLVQSLAAAEAGALRMADELATLVTTTASSIGSVEGQMWGGVIGGRGFLNQGRFDDARQQFDLAAGAAIDLNLVLQLGWARGGSLLAAAQSGDAPGVRRCLDALDSLPPTELRLMAGELERARGWAAVTLGDVRRGVDCFVRAADTAADAKQPGLEVIALHDLVRIGMNGHAVRLSEVAARVQGDLAAARRSHADAVLADDHAMFADVASHFEAIGAVVFAAEAANHGAWVARRNGRAGAAEELRTRVLRLRAMRPEAATPGLAGHAGFALLTVREREVIEMAAAGESSKSIAARLEVSVRTVDNLLQRAYRKLGVRGRDDLRGLHLA